MESLNLNELSLNNNTDIKLDEAKDKSVELLYEKHLSYLINLDKTIDKDAIGFYTNEYLRMAALYWGISALNVLGKIDLHNQEATLNLILACQHENGGFGGSIGHDPHMTSTHYAILILLQFNKTHLIDAKKVALFVKSLQKEDGSYGSDKWGECDTRFSYCAVSILNLLNLLNEEYIDLPKATEYVLSCQNFDGGFGGIPNAESHAAYTFTCCGFLSVTNQLKMIDRDHTGQWLAARQTHHGGFNGRPEKLADVCYSWWVLSSMYMLGTDDFIDKKLLIKWILDCQDDEGGFADRTGNYPDVFHTFFGLAGLSLLGYGNLNPINATYAIPQSVVKSALNI
jgi:geranylgeranyl transferase type-2 subunit beta